MNKTKVLIVQRYYYNFREGFFNQLYSAFPDFLLINSLKSKGRVTVHSDIIEHNKYIFSTKCLFFSKSIVFFPFLILNILKIRPKLIISEGGQNTINNLQILLYCLLFKTPYIIWDLGKGYKVFKQNFFRQAYMSLYKAILRRATFIYGYNSSSYDYFVSLGISSEKIIILNNTVDTVSIKSIIDNQDQKISERITLEFDSAKTYLIFVGSLLPSKNIEDLDLIMSGLGEKYHLLIIGSGQKDYVDKLKVLFKNINHTFLGYKKIEELFPYYHISSFCILPGLGGLAINQAMAFGLPVLCRKADGAERDIIINDYNGLIYNDISEIIKYILGKSNKDWSLMGKNAKETIYCQFSIEQQVEKFIYGINQIVE